MIFDFIQQYFDQPNVGDTDANKGQCVGLVEVYTDSLGLIHTWGNAKDLLTNADPNAFDIIQNTPDNIPVQGDIFVFGDSYGGGFGHTGIVVWASLFLVCLFEQNDGLREGTPQLKTYLYDGALGWLHPKTPQPHPSVAVPIDTGVATVTVPVTMPSPVVNTSTHIEPSDMLSATSENVTTTTKPVIPHGPIKTPFTLGDRIVWVLTNILSVLKKLRITIVGI